MRLFIRTFCVLACCLVVAGCSTFSEDFDSSFGDDEGARETVYYDSDDIDVGMTYPEMAREMSNGSVQIYGLDDPAVPMVLAQSGPRNYTPATGMPSSSDPNVTVFPLDDNAYVQPQLPRARPQLQPPSESYRPLNSPFGGAIQTPVPMDAPQPMPEFAPQPFAPSAPAAPQPQYNSDSNSRIYYKHGSSQLGGTGKQVVDFVAAKGAPVSVEGHASERAETDDPIERDIVNLKMSMDRAFKVSSELIRKGVPVESIETKAYGAGRPAAPVPGISPEASSRRVEINTASSRQQTANNDVIRLRPPAGMPAPQPLPLNPPAAPIPPLARY